MEKSENNPIGIVASGTTHATMTFYATESIRTDYVCVDDGSGKQLIYEVLREVVQNNRLTDADTVRFIEAEDDYRYYNVYVGEAVPIACLDSEGRISRDVYGIAPPGSWVYRAGAEELAQAYDVAPMVGRQKIGTLLRQRQVDVCLDLDQLLCRQVHLAVVGRTGSGKSWFVQHILDFLKMRCMIFSPTDEYDLLHMPHETMRKKDTVLRLNSEMAKRVLGLNASEQRFFRDFMKREMEDRPYSSDELSAKMASYFRKSETQNREDYQISLLESDNKMLTVQLPQYAISLCQKIEEIECQIQKTDVDYVEEPATSIVYNLQGCRRSEEEQIIYSTLLPIFESRKRRFSSNSTELSPEDHIVIVLEEAQNYAPSTRSTLCKELLVDIARTGRKYGMHILFLSQRPRYIDQTILSQCGGGVFFNLPNPEDVDYVMNSASLNRAAPYKHMIQNFDTGECIFLRAERSCLDLPCKISSFK